MYKLKHVVCWCLLGITLNGCAISRNYLGYNQVQYAPGAVPRDEMGQPVMSKMQQGRYVRS